ncbi:MAG TPA: hypothetical protein VMT89_06180 [Candidatus Acidoferrales bacterium]|nr:hypothetical protein [Candidatus Acidoferrales bacterium]
MRSNATWLTRCFCPARSTRVAVAALAAIGSSIAWRWAAAEVRKPRRAQVTVEREKEGSFATFERHALETQTIPVRTPVQSKQTKR